MTPLNRTTVLVLIANIVMMAITFSAARYAMSNTPDVVEFRRFVHPSSTKREGKVAFLWSPFFLQGFFLFCYLGQWRFYPEKRTPKWFIAMLIAFVASTAMGVVNARDAVQAAARKSSIHNVEIQSSGGSPRWS